MPQVSLHDYQDEKKTLTLDFIQKTDHGFTCLVSNKLFEFEMLFSYIEALGLLNYFRRLNALNNGVVLEDLNLDRHGILFKNAFFEKGDITYVVEINIESPDGNLRFTSNNLHSVEKTEMLESIIQGK